MGPMLGRENPIFMAHLHAKTAEIVKQKAPLVDDLFVTAQSGLHSAAEIGFLEDPTRQYMCTRGIR